MSWRAIAWAKQTKVGDATRKAILLVLADYADEEGSCYPSQETIADEAETSARTVRRVLAEFDERGLIERRPRYANGGRTSDRIFLNLRWAIEPTLDFDAPVPANLTGGQSDRWTETPPVPANGDSSTGHSLAEEPPVEPEEPPEKDSSVGATAPTPEVEELCQYMAKGMVHHGHTQPRITASWYRDMDLLLRRGPVEWDARPIPAVLIRETIKVIYTKLNVRRGTFCWANVIQSPGNLRKSWAKLDAEIRELGVKAGGEIAEARRIYELLVAEDETDHGGERAAG